LPDLKRAFIIILKIMKKGKNKKPGRNDLLDRRGVKALLLAITVALAITGQVFLLKQHVVVGILCYLLSMADFCLVARGNPLQEPRPASEVRRKFIRAPLLVLSAFILSFLVASMVYDERPIPFQRWAEPAGWLLSILLFAFGILYGSDWRFPRPRDIQEAFRRSWKEVATVSVIVLAALLVRTIDLSSHPYAVANDEGLAGLESLRLLNPGEGSLFTTASAAMPKLNFAPTALAVLILGRTFLAVRLPIAMIGTLTVLFTYFAAREMFGKRVGLIAATILAFLPVAIHFSRTGFYSIIFAYFAVLLIWLTLRAVRLGRMSSFLLAGAATAAAFYTHMGAWLAMIFPPVIFMYLCFFRRGWLRQNWLNLVIFVSIVLIVMAPQAVFFIKHPDMFMARYQGVGLLETEDSLGGHALSTSTNLWAVMGDQLLKSGLAFISIGASSGFFNTPQPYFMALTAVFLMLGMGFSCLRIRKLAPLLLLTWFWSVLLIEGMLTTNAPASNRLVMGFPAAAILVGVGLEQFSQSLTRFLRLQAILIATVLLVASVYGVSYYFGDYRTHDWYGDPSNEVEFETASLMEQLGRGYRLVLLGEPRVTVDFPNFEFFLPGYQMGDVEEGNATPAFSGGERVLYVAIPERRAELEQFTARYPGGSWLDLQRRWFGDEPLLSAYVYPPARLKLYTTSLPPQESHFKVSIPAWVWWLVVIVGAVLLDLVVLPTLWRKVNRQKPSPPREPWKSLHKWGAHLMDWLKH
jgi:4-amino-4-deoxy-L-arabinose transferase-like glycosyltransferase